MWFDYIYQKKCITGEGFIEGLISEDFMWGGEFERVHEMEIVPDSVRSGTNKSIPPLFFFTLEKQVVVSWGAKWVGGATTQRTPGGFGRETPSKGRRKK